MTTAAARTRLSLAALALASAVGTAGCARAPSDRPDLGLPPDPDRGGLERRENSGSDVRTINSTGNAPNGPVSPAGSTPGSRGELGEPAGGSIGGPRSAVPAVPKTSPGYAPLLAFADNGDAALSSGGGGASLLGDSPRESEENDSAEPAGYRTVGGVLAEVNGRPIYTDEVIAARRPELRGLAVRLPRDQFLREAANVLSGEVTNRINDELRLVLAEKNLRPSDQQKAVFLTTQWRVRQITDAGGSEAVARQRALDDSGVTLDKLAQITYGRYASVLFSQLVMEPRATPSADEVRDYFRRHRDEFATEGTLQFLLIEVNAAQEPQKAQLKAGHLRDLAAGGEDFEALAKSDYNDNPFYRKSGGRLANPEPLPKGSVAWPELEAALWQTPEGGVTPVVAIRGGSRLLVAKLLEKREPSEADFAEAQSVINAMIRGRRMEALLREYLLAARQYAVVTPPPQIDRAMQTALEVVAQDYDALRSEK